MKSSQKRPLIITAFSTLMLGTAALAAECLTTEQDKFFSERNCNSFVMHVSSLMYKERTAKPISRSGNKVELMKRCRSESFSYTKIDCSLNATTLDQVHSCIYTSYSSFAVSL